MKFLDFAYRDKDRSLEIPCPCKICHNFRPQKKDVVYSHLMQKGISLDYIRWIEHGETSTSHSEDYVDDGEDDTLIDESDDMSDDDLDDMLDNIGQSTWGDDWKTSGKSEGRKALRTPSLVPKNFYEAKKYVRDLGFGVQKIHACVNGCVLYRKKYALLTHCPECFDTFLSNLGFKDIPRIVKHGNTLIGNSDDDDDVDSGLLMAAPMRNIIFCSSFQMENEDVDQQLGDGDRHIVLTIQGGLFNPSNNLTSTITSIWKSRFTRAWDNWTIVPAEDKEIWFNSFKIQRISLIGFPAQSVGSSNTDVLDLLCLLVLIIGTSQSRQHGLRFLTFFNDPRIIWEQRIAAFKGYRGGGVVRETMTTVDQGMSVEEIERVVAQRVVNAIEAIAIYETKTNMARKSISQTEQQECKVAENANNKRKWEGNHNGQCTVKFGNCKKVDHMTQDCRNPAAARNQRTHACYECGSLRHFKSECPIVKFQKRVDKKISTLAERQTENKRKFENTSRNSQNQQQQQIKRQNTGRAYTAGSGDKKPYGGSRPLCSK
ncbi:reverse transcriptase domain-containing protein [Tanacetum coccineum]